MVVQNILLTYQKALVAKMLSLTSYSAILNLYCLRDGVLNEELGGGGVASEPPPSTSKADTLLTFPMCSKSDMVPPECRGFTDPRVIE